MGMFTGDTEDRLEDVLAGKVLLLNLSEYDRALIAGNPRAPAEVLETLSLDESPDVANWLLGNFDLSEAGVHNILANHPGLSAEAGHHPHAPLDLIAMSAASSLSATTMQAYMDRVGASRDDWDRVHAALAVVHPPGGPTIGDLVPPPS